MKQEQLRPGLRVGYRWPEWTTHSGPPIADAIIVDAEWTVPADRRWEGEEVQTSARPGATVILFRLPGHHPELRALADAASFVSYRTIELRRRAQHFARHGINLRPGGGGMEVALVDLSGEGIRWEPVVARLDARGALLVRKASGEELVDVDACTLYGPAWIRIQHDRARREEEAAAERARRAALKADTAERLGLARESISLGRLPFGRGGPYSHSRDSDEEVLLVISPAALAGLIDRALSDPAWADAVRGEGVLDALAALGGS